MKEAGVTAAAVLRLCGRTGRLSFGQHLRELVRGIAEQGSDHHRDNQQDQRVGERGRDQVLQWAGATDSRSIEATMTRKNTVTPTTIAGQTAPKPGAGTLTMINRATHATNAP